jgi:hypothetical protein
MTPEEEFQLRQRRPTSPDFETLAAIIRALDARAETEEDVVLELVQAADLDPYTAAYMAQQRGLRAAALLDEDVVTSLAATWLEGFTVGAKWQREIGGA